MKKITTWVMGKFFKLLLWGMSKVFNSSMRKDLEPHIVKMYSQIAKDDLVVDSRIVKVKKGRSRYELFFLKTPNGEWKFNLGRHKMNDHNVECIIPSK